jgi:hypothetical protein
MPERRLLLVAVLVLAGCRGMTSTKPPIHPNPNMDQQPKARPHEDRAYFDGKDAAGADVAH